MHRHLINLLVAATLCVSARALAGDPKAGTRPGTPSTTKSAPDHADELFEQATAAYDAGRLPEAHAKLLEAWALKKTHDIAGNLGVVELKLGEHAQAAEHLTWALQHFPPTEADQAKRGFEQKLAKARAQIGALRVRVNVEGAEVTVNGRAMGKAPLDDEAFVEAGTVRVSARREGYAAVEQVVSVAKGEAREVVIALVVVTAAPVKAGPPVALMVVSGVLAVGGLAAGAGLTVAANGKASGADALRSQVSTNSACGGTGAGTPNCVALMNGLKSRDSLTKAAFTSFVVGGAFALAAGGLGVWTIITPKDQKSAPPIRIAPAVGRAEAGLVVAGSF